MVRSDIVDLVRRLSDIKGLETIAMTTNGLTLSRKLEILKAAGLTHLNISLDTLVPSKFEFVSRRPKAGHPKVLYLNELDFDVRGHFVFSGSV